MEAIESKVLYDYTKQEPDEISTVKGDIVTDIDQLGGELWKVTLKRTGERGLIPANYVEVTKSHDTQGHNELKWSKDICKFPSEVITFEKFIRQGWNESWWFEGSIVDQEFRIIPIALKTWGKDDILRERYFLGRAKTMSQLNHDNVMKFIGVYLSHHPACIVLELLAEGDLLTLLHEAHGPISKDPPKLFLSDQTQIAIDAAQGCQYLQEQRIIHLNIMAQNCYVVNRGGSSGRSIKIGGFDLAVKMIDDVFKTSKSNSDKCPVKWSAPELFNSESITTEVDKWSFGVMLYEIFSLGTPPYLGLDNTAVVSYITGGGRMSKPTDCPDNIYEIMQHCWELLPDKRISYDNILLTLNCYLDELNQQQEQQAAAANTKSSLKSGLMRIFQKGKASNRSVDDQDTADGSAAKKANLNIICEALVNKYHEEISECDDDFTFYEDANKIKIRISKILLANLQILGLNQTGSTNYGTFHEGTLKEDSTDRSISVTVKTMKPVTLPLAKFLSEAKTIRDFNHKNIIKFIGVCLDRDPVCIVMERFHGKDSLQAILRATYSSINELQAEPFNFSLANSIQIALDIAEACMYLQYQKVIHTYIAACNCYLFRNQATANCFTTKLGGFDDAISLSVKDSHYEIPQEYTYPVKWTPPEVFLESKYTLESDIWSYGILLWELFYDGRMPYPGIAKVETKEMIQKGNRLDKPPKCPQKIYFSIMKACWLKSCDERIKFDKIIESLREYLGNVSELEKSLLNEEAEPPAPTAITEPNSSSSLSPSMPPTDTSLYYDYSSEYEDIGEAEKQADEQSKDNQKENETSDLRTQVPSDDKDTSTSTEQQAPADDTEPNTSAGSLPSTELFIVKKKQISARLALPKNHKARGIIFIVGVYGADGTEIDVENIETTFKELNFATYIVQDPPADEISALIQAAADVQLYPYKYEYVAFYFAGHGGRDEEGKMFIVGLQKDDEKKEILYVDDHIINPLKCLHERKISRLFFFDCCQSKGEGTAYRSATVLKKKSKPNPGEVIAYATNDGEKSWGDREKGGIWTYHLCKNFREIDEPITTILSKTYDDVVEARDSFQQPLVVASLGMRKLKGIIGQPASAPVTAKSSDSVSTNALSTSITESTDSMSANAGSLDLKEVDQTVQLEKEYTEFDIKKLKDPPTHETIFQSLKNKTHNWNAIGRASGVDLNYRETLQANMGITEDIKLEKIIARWNEKNPITWDSFIAVLRKLEYNDVIIQLMKKVENQKPDTSLSQESQPTARDNFQLPPVGTESTESTTTTCSDSLKEDCTVQLEKENDHLRLKNNTDSEISQQKQITVQAVCSALKDYSSHWNDFACELEVDDEYRDTLETDNSLSDEEKLERIITQWIEKGTCREVSWDKIISVNEDLQFETKDLKEASKICLIMKPDIWKEIFDCLKRKASCWSDLAQELKIDDSFRNELDQSTIGNDRRKLEKVIKEWLDESKGYEPTWEKIIRAVKEIPELAEEVEELMKKN